MNRDEVLLMNDDELVRYCDLEFFKSSGNGGQKRNKTSSAVRVRINFNGIELAADDCSERSQHQNRHQALKKLRRKIAYEIRVGDTEELLIKSLNRVGETNTLYPLYMAQVIDLIDFYQYDIKKAAESLGISHSKLDKELRHDSNLYQEIQNKLRQKVVKNS